MRAMQVAGRLGCIVGTHSFWTGAASPAAAIDIDLVGIQQIGFYLGEPCSSVGLRPQFLFTGPRSFQDSLDVAAISAWANGLISSGRARGGCPCTPCLLLLSVAPLTPCRPSWLSIWEDMT
ncbi:hypothetical protein JRQ81_010576 [Phrynocephalus forsythii]|uniref:Uncharacterized protein n=1 Tax=Phrynocephalus forsythii TaxID=171643 RepID=A0A9Q0Y080_9SAUR|nr:hypothetical protein JRQ81_010576 [Phrynocephalus forsythii]